MPGSLVVARTFLGAIEAEVAKGLLEEAGIRAVVSADDCGGVRPELQAAMGVRLLVVEEDRDEAVRVLDETAGSIDEE